MGVQTVLAPSSNLEMEIKVVEVEDDGDIRYTFLIQDVSVTDREGTTPGSRSWTRTSPARAGAPASSSKERAALRPVRARRGMGAPVGGRAGS